MAQILKLAQVNTTGIENQHLDVSEIVGDSFTFGGASGTNVTKTIVDLLIAQTHAPMSDNQNVVAGNGLTGGGAGATVNLAVLAFDLSISSAAGGISVNKSANAGLVVAVDGLALNPDGSTLELNTNVLRIKDLGVSTAKLANNAVTDTKLSSDASVDANRAVGTNHIKDASVTSDKLDSAIAGSGLSGGAGSALSVNVDGTTLEINADTLRIKDAGVTDAKVATGISAAKIGSGSVDNTEFSYLDGVTSAIQTQIDSKVPNTRQVNTTAPITGGGALSADLTIAMPAATGSVNGYLTSTDWTTFNNKQPAGAYLTALTGDVTAAGPGSSAAVVAFVGGSTAALVHSAELLANAATPNNVNLAIVKRDAAGGFNAGTIVATFTGNLTGNVTGTASGNPPNARLINTTAPLTGGGDLSADRTIAMPAATTSVNGYLTSTDWTTFNNKQPAGNYITALTGHVVATGPGSVGATIQNNVVTEFMLTASVAGSGLSGGNGTPLAVNVDGTTLTIVADTLQVNQSPLIKRTLTAGESFAANTSFLVRWALTGETAGRVYKADSGSAASQGKFYGFGLALSTGAVTAGQTIDVISLGSHTLGSSDTPFAGTDVGKAVYLTTAGAFSLTPTTTSAAAVWRFGVVRATNQIDIGMHQLNGINP